MVSIPERVLEALKLTKGKVAGGAQKVSIPERVLEALKLSTISAVTTASSGFNP